MKLQLAVSIAVLAGLEAPGTAPVVFDSESVRFRVETVAEGLETPSALVFLPDAERS